MPTLPATLPIIFDSDEDAAAYARQLKSLLPPGRLWNLIGDSKLGRLLLAAADELARIHARAKDLLEEMIPATAIEMIGEWETQLGIIPADGALLATRRANVIARMVRRQRFRPIDFQVALAPILGLAIASVPIIERDVADCAAMRDQREHFRFLVFRDWTLPGTYDLAEADKLITRMKPSHTLGVVFETQNMICDEPHSLCDRDLLGA